MALNIEQIENEALKLPLDSRARLVQHLLSSLEHLSASENERLWAEEAERRYLELSHQPGLARDAETVFADIRASLK